MQEDRNDGSMLMSVENWVVIDCDTMDGWMDRWVVLCCVVLRCASYR